MQTTGSGGPLPGWYPDPAQAKAWRWWDGYRWTEHASDPARAGGSEGWPMAGASGDHLHNFAPTSVHQCVAAEQRAAPWAKRGFALYLLVVVFGLFGAWAESSHLRDVFHTIREQMRSGTSFTDTHQSTGLNVISLLDLVVAVPFYVLVLRWQLQATRTARLLRLPAKLSPGLGVGGWFIPVVNLWFPYQAIRDCLPPADPGRRTVSRWWTMFITLFVLNIITAILAIVGTPVAFATGAATFAATVGFVVTGIRVVQRVTDAHQRLSDPESTGQSALPIGPRS